MMKSLSKLRKPASHIYRSGFLGCPDALPTRYLWIRCTVIYSFIHHRVFMMHHFAQVHYLVDGLIVDYIVKSPMVHLMISPQFPFLYRIQGSWPRIIWSGIQR